MQKDKNMIEIKEDTVIKQDDKKIILEKGDRIKILEAVFLPNDDRWTSTSRFPNILFKPREAVARFYINDDNYFQIEKVESVSDVFYDSDEEPIRDTYLRLIQGTKTGRSQDIANSDYESFESIDEVFKKIQYYILKSSSFYELTRDQERLIRMNLDKSMPVEIYE